MTIRDDFPPTRLAILRTIGSLHDEPLAYDLKSLRDKVLEISPELLCADIPRDVWEAQAFSSASLEIARALAPAAAQSDTVIVPIGPDQILYENFSAPPGWRNWLSGILGRSLDWAIRKADRVESIHGLAFQTFCHSVCALEEMTWTPEDRLSHHARTSALVQNVINAVRRDPGRRMLVVLQCQWQHSFESMLKRSAGDWLKVVHYQEL